MKKNTAGQYWRVFCFNYESGAPVTGNAANITAVINIDNAGEGATNDVNPTEIGGGYYDFTLSQAETNGDVLTLRPTTATATSVVVPCPPTIYTEFPQTGDSFARIGANGASLTSLATAANQTTILARLGAWTGSGVNTILGAFKALLSKTATLPTDIGGTFTPTTDSTEALAEAFTGVQVLGPGSDLCTLTITDDNGDVIPDADVWLTASIGGATIAGTSQSDSNGHVPFMLDEGSTYYCYRQKDGMNITNPKAFIAVAD